MIGALLIGAMLAAAPPPAVTDLVRRADDAFALGRPDQAISLYEQAEKLDPSFDDFHRLQHFLMFDPRLTAPGSGLRENEKVDTALRVRIGEAMARAWRHHPDRAEILERATRTLVSEGACDAALALTGEALQRNPRDPAALTDDVMAQEADAVANPSRAEADAARINADIDRLLGSPATPDQLYQAGLQVCGLVVKPTITEAARMALIRRGEAAFEKAIAGRSGYAQAMIYHSLLLRQEAQRQSDPKQRDALVARANKERAEAIAVLTHHQNEH